MAFPVNVPNVPGVPAVLFAPGAGDIIELLTEDVLSLFSGAFASQQWGIYLGGAPVVTCDNVKSFDYRQEFSLSDYPVERGAFETYDKVQIPFDARFTFTAGGSAANRQALLDSVQAIVGDMNLYDVVTPEAVYESVNISHQDYSRSDGRVGLIVINVWALQVRVAPSAAMSSTQDPSSASQVNGGTQQPTDPTPAQAAQAPAIAGPPENFPGQP